MFELGQIANAVFPFCLFVFQPNELATQFVTAECEIKMESGFILGERQEAQ